MKTRIRLLSDGRYAAEYKTIFFIWISCYYEQWYESTERETYPNEVHAKDALKKFCKQQQEVSNKKENSINYETKYYDCKDLI